MDLDSKNKDLIRRYINKQCTPAELEDMKRLILLPDAERLFNEVLAESWTGLQPETDTDQPYLNDRLEKFYTRLQEHSPATDYKATRIIKLRKYLSYAAILTVAVMGFVGYRILNAGKISAPQIAMREMSNPYGRRSKVILPDSSEVYLGAGSKLMVPEQFTGNTREISLQGEAFFQVTKNPLKPFIIHTGNVQTRVLGTSFKIEAFAGHPLVVSVATGKVRVDKYEGNTHTQLAILMPGQKVSYSNDKAFAGSVAVADVTSWKDARLVFKSRSLHDITDELERWYNVKFVYGNAKKADEKITVVLQADMPLYKIMKVLAATGHFKVSIKGEKVNIN